jgi:ribonuclease HI
MTITAAADGSALGNPGPAGWAWYIDDNNWAAGGWKHATNNQGELKAVLELFRATAHVDDDLLVLCDSQYVINSVTKWMRGWKAKGWRKADGKAVMNLELLQEIDEALVGRRYRFEWVKGHANHPLNEAADARARAVSEAYQRNAAIPTGPGFVAGGPVPASTPAVRAAAAKATRAPVAAGTTATAPRAAVDLGLFDLEVERPHTVQVALSADELGRLKRRATSRGVSPEELLRDLI